MYAVEQLIEVCMCSPIKVTMIPATSEGDINTMAYR